MRLLCYDSRNEISLTRDLAEHERPPYAILSHCWAEDNREEVTFAEIETVAGRQKPGYQKIQFCAEQARRDKITHFWVDTCCIDKTNQVELSRAITSMFRWYQQAEKCYVYLPDVNSRERSRNDVLNKAWESSFRTSRWFKRGWTLQELLAPRVVQFFSRERDILGDKITLATQIHEITTIPLSALSGADLARFPVEERIRWTEKRQTKETEDKAYCLLGIFNVHLLFHYGEGENAWRRLRREIQDRYGRDIDLRLGEHNHEQARPLGLCLGSAPLINTSDFVGRTDDIARIYEILRPAEVNTIQRKAVLGGIGGVGKTQLALAYAQHHQQYYPSVLWLNATSEVTLKSSFLAVTQGLIAAPLLAESSDDQVIARAREWLSRRDNTRWLLIFDNYDEPDQFKIEEYMPNIGHGSIIVTTRLPEFVTGSTIRVQPLQNIEDGLDILAIRSQRINVHKDTGARSLTKRLDGLPLALVTAGAFLRKSTLTFQQYLDAYEQKWNINPRRPVKLQEYQDRTLFTTWTLLYDRLRKEEPDAAEMLQLLAYFDNQDVWYDLLAAGLADESPEWLQGVLEDQTSFESTMAVLIDYCLVDLQHARKSYSIHSCVHDWTLGELNKVIVADLYWYTFSCVARSIEWNDWEALSNVKYGRVSLHAKRLTHPRFAGSDELNVGIAGHENDTVLIAHLLAGQIQLPAAEQMYRRALAGKETALGPDHTSTLDTVNNLGILYVDQGKLEQAEQMYRRALAGKETALGPDHTSTLGTARNLSVLYQARGRFKEATALESSYSL